MIEINYLEEYLYHMTHLENLVSILQSGALLSQEQAIRHRVIAHSIANDEVQALRNRVFILDNATGEFRNLHCYVPLYFTIRNSMLYRKFKDGIQDEIIVLEIDYSILQNDGVIFTDGNASVQRLSDTKRNIGETVEIKPATSTENGFRRYKPHGRPYGTGQTFSEFYADTTLLERLDWIVINGTDFNDPEKSRKICAEVLVPDMLPLTNIRGIAVNNYAMIQKVNDLIIHNGIADQMPLTTLKPNLFF